MFFHKKWEEHQFSKWLFLGKGEDSYAQNVQATST